MKKQEFLSALSALGIVACDYDLARCDTNAETVAGPSDPEDDLAEEIVAKIWRGFEGAACLIALGMKNPGAEFAGTTMIWTIVVPKDESKKPEVYRILTGAEPQGMTADAIMTTRMARHASGGARTFDNVLESLRDRLGRGYTPANLPQDVGGLPIRLMEQIQPLD